MQENSAGIRPGPNLQSIPGNAEQEKAPKRRGRPPGSKNKTSRASLKTEIGGTLTLFNMALAMTPYRADALDSIEIEALADALNEQAKQSPTFYRYISWVVKTTSGSGSLFGVVAIIGARRMARHGFLPEQFDAQLGGLLALSTGKMPAPQSADNS